MYVIIMGSEGMETDFLGSAEGESGRIGKDREEPLAGRSVPWSQSQEMSCPKNAFIMENVVGHDSLRTDCSGARSGAF